MIQIHSPNQFTSAAERARKERMMVRARGFRQYEVTNRSKGNSYTVYFSKLNGKFFGTCTCEAGLPMKGNRVPMVCKHLYAAFLVCRAFAGKIQQPPLNLKVVDAFGPGTELEGVTVCCACVSMMEMHRCTVIESHGTLETACEVCRASAVA
jgi:hypothetical protein